MEQIKVPRVKLGSQGFQVSKLGFGCMNLSGAYDSAVPDEGGIAILKHAFNKGITFFDTSDVYGPHTNETLIGKFFFGTALKFNNETRSWTLDRDLPKGSYEYKYIVNGEQTWNKSEAITGPNGDGHVNIYIQVPAVVQC